MSACDFPGVRTPEIERSGSYTAVGRQLPIKFETTVIFKFNWFHTIGKETKKQKNVSTMVTHTQGK